MRFDFTFYADSSYELRDMMDAARNALPMDLFAKRPRHFAITVSPEAIDPEDLCIDRCFTAVEALDTTTARAFVAGMIAEKAVEAATAEPEAKPARKVRASKAETPAAEPAPVPEPETEDDEVADALAASSDPEPETTGAAETMSPADAKMKALDSLRSSFVAAGGPAGVKKLQGHFGVTKFADVPDARGHELLTAATTLAATLGAA